MRKISILAVGLALAAFVGSAAYAGCGNCEAGAKKKAKCGDTCLEGIELTADQQASVKKLMATCSEIGCDETSKKKMMEGLKKILSEEQMEKLNANCKKKCGDKGETAQLSVLDNQFACGSSCGGKKGGEKDDSGEDA